MTNFLRAAKGFMRGSGRSNPADAGLPVPAGLAPTAAFVRSRRDREFLPAALSILESPPSPVHTALMAVICVFAFSALVWSWVGRIDIVAVAVGKVQPEGQVKTIQSLDTGRVELVNVANGDRVRKGDVLFTLDPSDARVDIAEMTASLAAFQAETLRRTAAVASVGRDEPVAIAWPDDTPPSIRRREDAVLLSDFKQLRATLAGLAAQSKQKQAERQRLEDTITAQSALVGTLRERVGMRADLLATGSGAKSAVLDARESFETQAANLAYQKGQRGENEAAIAVVGSDIEKTVQTFIQDNTQKLGEAERQADDYTQKLERAHVKGRQTVVSSPIDGQVQGSTITTVGQVLSPGEEVMRIVPGGTRLEVNAYLPNKDVGFVQAGQEVVVKVESFPFTRYGTLKGKVVFVAPDAIPEPDAEAADAAPARAMRGDRNIAGGQHTRNLVYPMTIELASRSIEADGRVVPLIPGMAVSAEIKTGNRRMLDYILSPVTETVSTAMKER